MEYQMILHHTVCQMRRSRSQCHRTKHRIEQRNMVLIPKFIIHFRSQTSKSQNHTIRVLNWAWRIKINGFKFQIQKLNFCVVSCTKGKRSKKSPRNFRNMNKLSEMYSRLKFGMRYADGMMNIVSNEKRFFIWIWMTWATRTLVINSNHFNKCFINWNWCKR